MGSGAAGSPWEQHVEEALRDRLDFLCPHAGEAARERVAACHAAGILVRCWGVGQDERRMRAVLAAGADGATVHAPAVLARNLGERSGGRNDKAEWEDPRAGDLSSGTDSAPGGGGSAACRLHGGSGGHAGGSGSSARTAA